MPMEGAKHDALFDCIHQIKVLLAARDRWPHAEVLAA
jgi:hypothetical protein